jgi:hypothetical protein
MHSSTAEVKIQDEYPRLQTGGWWAIILGVAGAIVLLTVGLTTRLVLPTGLASLTMGGYVTGAVVLSVRAVLIKLDAHQADHQQATLTVEDVERINARLDSLDRRAAETQELLAHTSVCQSAPPALEPASGERRAYANGAVDMLDGRTAVVPMNGGPGLRIVPVQDERW